MAQVSLIDRPLPGSAGEALGLKDYAEVMSDFMALLTFQWVADG